MKQNLAKTKKNTSVISYAKHKLQNSGGHNLLSGPGAQKLQW